MLRLAMFSALLFCASRFMHAEDVVEILDLNTGKPVNPPTRPAPDSSTEKKPTPKGSTEVDEPGFKASVRFAGQPKPKYDQGSTDAQTITVPKNKSWSVPIEEGSNGPIPSLHSAESADAAAAEKSAATIEIISPTLASAIAREKAGAKPVEMISIYRAISKSESDNAAPHYRLGLALLRGGQIKEGLVELETTIAMEPRNPKYLCDYSVASLRAGWIEKSFAAIQAAIEVSPNTARYQSALGDVHLTAQHLPEAIEAYTRAVKLEPENSIYFYNLGLVYMRSNEFKRAAECFTEAIQLKPKPAYHCSRGLAFENMKIHKNAFLDYDAALKLDKNCAYAHYLFAGIFSDGEDPTYTNKFEAIEHAQKAVKLTDGKNAQYLMGLARAYRVARDYDRATKTAKLAVELEPARSDLRREFAEIEQSKMQGLAK